jgi:thiol:disulfide interchange protein DsbD
MANDKDKSAGGHNGAAPGPGGESAAEDGRNRKRFMTHGKMLLLFVVAWGALYLVLGQAHTGSVEMEVDWQTDLQQARAEAAESGRVIFADFYADWCQYCREMDRDVFSQDEFAAELEKMAVPVRIDTDLPAGKALATQYQVAALPAYLVLRADGTAIGRGEGTATAESLLRLVRRAAANR